MIGKRCKNVAPDSYLDVVAGYTIMNDVSMRDIQMKEMKRSIMMMGKKPRHDGADRPLSRHPRTRSPIRRNLQVSTFVNGERRQFAKGPNDI